MWVFQQPDLGEDVHDDHSNEDGHDEHTEDFYKEIEHVIEEFEAGEITQSQSIEEIEEILSEHEGDGHGHEGAIEDIEHLIHEIEEVMNHFSLLFYRIRHKNCRPWMDQVFKKRS